GPVPARPPRGPPASSPSSGVRSGAAVPPHLLAADEVETETADLTEQPQQHRLVGELTLKSGDPPAGVHRHALKTVGEPLAQQSPYDDPVSPRSHGPSIRKKG